MYREGLVRFASLPYSTEKKHLRDAYRHLTNYSINKIAENFVENSELLADNVGHKWSFSALNKHLKCTGVDAALMWNRIGDLVVKSLLGVAPSIASKVRDVVSHRQCCFELYGFDVMVDSNLKPWLLEVNLSPSMSAESPLDWHIKSSLLRDSFNLVGIPKADRSSVGEARARTSQTRHVQRRAGIGLPQSLDTPLDHLSTEELKTLAHALGENDRVRNFIRLHPTVDSTKRYAELLVHSGKLTSSQRLAQLLFPKKQQEDQARTTSSQKTRARRSGLARSNTNESEAVGSFSSTSSSSASSTPEVEAASTVSTTAATTASATPTTKANANTNGPAPPPPTCLFVVENSSGGTETHGGSTSSTNHCPEDRPPTPGARRSSNGFTASAATAAAAAPKSSQASDPSEGGDPFCLNHRPTRCQSAGRLSASNLGASRENRPSSGPPCGRRVSMQEADVEEQSKEQTTPLFVIQPLHKLKLLDHQRSLGRSCPQKAWEAVKVLGKTNATNALVAEYLHRLAQLSLALGQTPWKSVLPNALGARLVSLCGDLKAKLGTPETPKESLPTVVAKLTNGYMTVVIARLLAAEPKNDSEHQAASPSRTIDDDDEGAMVSHNDDNNNNSNDNDNDDDHRDRDLKDRGNFGEDFDPKSPMSETSRQQFSTKKGLAERLAGGPIFRTSVGRKALLSLSLIPNRVLEELLASSTLDSELTSPISAGLPKNPPSPGGTFSWQGTRYSNPQRGALRPQWPRRRPGSAARARNAAMQQNGLLTEFDLLVGAIAAAGESLNSSDCKERDCPRHGIGDESCHAGSPVRNEIASTAATTATPSPRSATATASFTSAATATTTPTATISQSRPGTRPSTAPRNLRHCVSNPNFNANSYSNSNANSYSNPARTTPTTTTMSINQMMTTLSHGMAPITTTVAGAAGTVTPAGTAAAASSATTGTSTSSRPTSAVPARPGSATRTALGATTTPYMTMSRPRSGSSSTTSWGPPMGSRNSKNSLMGRPSGPISNLTKSSAAQPRRAGRPEMEGPTITRTKSAPEGLMAPNLPTRRTVTQVPENQSQEARRQLQAYLEATKSKTRHKLPVSASSKESTEAPASLVSGSSDNDTRTTLEGDVQRIQASAGPGGAIRISRNCPAGRRPSSACETASVRRPSTESLNAAVRRLDSKPFALPQGVRRRPSTALPRSSLRPGSALGTQSSSDMERLMECHQ